MLEANDATTSFQNKNIEEMNNNGMNDNNANTSDISGSYIIDLIIKNDTSKNYNISLNYDTIRKVHLVNADKNKNVNSTVKDFSSETSTTTHRTGSSYAALIVGVSLTVGLLIVILSLATIISYIQRKNHEKFLRLKEKERRIKLGQSVQSLKSTSDVLNLLSDTTKNDFNGHLIDDNKNIPLFQIGIYPNYSYKDLERKYQQQKSEQDITALFNEYNNPKKSFTHHSFSNNSNVASLFKNSRLYSQTLPTLNEENPTEEMDVSNAYGPASGSDFRSNSSTLHHSKYQSNRSSHHGSYTHSDYYTNSESYTCSESYTQSESYDEETEDTEKSQSLSQSIFSALRQKQSLRDSYKTKIGLDLIEPKQSKSNKRLTADSLSQDQSEFSHMSRMDEDSEPLPYYSLDMSESDFYNTEVSDSLDEINDITMKTMTSRHTKADDMNTSFSPSFIIASEKIMNENSESILKDINNSDNQNKSQQGFPTVSAMNTTSSNGINFSSKKFSPYSSMNNSFFNDRLKNKPSNESLSSTISSISNVRSQYIFAPSIYDNYSLNSETSEEETESEVEIRTDKRSSESKKQSFFQSIPSSQPQQSPPQQNPVDEIKLVGNTVSSSYHSTPIQNNSFVSQNSGHFQSSFQSTPQPQRQPQGPKSPYITNSPNTLTPAPPIPAVNNNPPATPLLAPPHSPHSSHSSYSTYSPPHSAHTASIHTISSNNTSVDHHSYRKNYSQSHSSVGYPPASSPNINRVQESEKENSVPYNNNNNSNNKNTINCDSHLIPDRTSSLSYNSLYTSEHASSTSDLSVHNHSRPNSNLEEMENDNGHEIENENEIDPIGTNPSTSESRHTSYNNMHQESHSQNSYSNMHQESHSNNPPSNYPPPSNYHSSSSYRHHSRNNSINNTNYDIDNNSNQLSNSNYEDPYQPPLPPTQYQQIQQHNSTKNESLIPSPISNSPASIQPQHPPQYQNENNYSESVTSTDDSYSNSVSYNQQSLSKSDVFYLNSPSMNNVVKKKTTSKRNDEDPVRHRYQFPALCQKTFKAQCTYMPRNNKKVPINYGDIIIISQIYDDGWAYGQVESVTNHTFREGLFPVIEMLEQGGLKEINAQDSMTMSSTMTSTTTTSTTTASTTNPSQSYRHGNLEEDSFNPNSNSNTTTNSFTNSISTTNHSNSFGMDPTPNQNPNIAPTPSSSPSVHSAMSNSNYHTKTPSMKTASTSTTHHSGSGTTVTHKSNYSNSYNSNSNNNNNNGNSMVMVDQSQSQSPVISSNAFPPHHHPSPMMAPNPSHISNHSKPLKYGGPTNPNYHSYEREDYNSNGGVSGSGNGYMKQNSYYVKAHQQLPPFSPHQTTVTPLSPVYSLHPSHPQSLPPQSPHFTSQSQSHLNKINSDIRDIRAMLRRGGIDTGTRKALQERLDQLELDKKRNYPTAMKYLTINS